MAPSTCGTIAPSSRAVSGHFRRKSPARPAICVSFETRQTGVASPGQGAPVCGPRPPGVTRASALAAHSRRRLMTKGESARHWRDAGCQAPMAPKQHVGCAGLIGGIQAPAVQLALRPRLVARARRGSRRLPIAQLARRTTRPISLDTLAPIALLGRFGPRAILSASNKPRRRQPILPPPVSRSLQGSARSARVVICATLRVFATNKSI